MDSTVAIQRTLRRIGAVNVLVLSVIGVFVGNIATQIGPPVSPVVGQLLLFVGIGSGVYLVSSLGVQLLND